jgi:hypothetical protein
MLLRGVNAAIRSPAARFRQARQAMTKKNCFLLAGMLMALVLPSLLVVALQPPRLSEPKYHRIKDGMTRTQVEAILGPPEIRSKQGCTYHIHHREIIFNQESAYLVDFVHTILTHSIWFDEADRVRGQAFAFVSETTTFR